MEGEMKTTWFIGTEDKGFATLAEMMAEIRRRAAAAKAVR